MAVAPFFLLADPLTIGGADIASLVRTAAYLLNFVAAYSVFDSLAVVFSSALRGAGDTVFPMVITLFSSWLIMVVPALIIIQSDHASILALADLHGAYFIQRDLHAASISVRSVAENSSD